VPAGTVKIQWQFENDGPAKGHLRIGWTERGGPIVNESQNNGFGHMILTRTVPTSLQGKASLQFQSEGVEWILVVPASSVLSKDQP
jgi:two-component sensor histidine kinase